MTEQMQTLAFRYLCLQTHYAKQMDFKCGNLVSAKKTLEKLYKFKDKVKTPKGECEECEEYDMEFQKAIDNNFEV